ncbi:hypothetical protein F5883DRAFT_569632 [Diaporthe sp. PMI_573]|nr:hypothetical protein F5883DRAFT_569632 [Diaporthaceae sp. PMI_573]
MSCRLGWVGARRRRPRHWSGLLTIYTAVALAYLVTTSQHTIISISLNSVYHLHLPLLASHFQTSTSRSISMMLNPNAIIAVVTLFVTCVPGVWFAIQKLRPRFAQRRARRETARGLPMHNPPSTAIELPVHGPSNHD